MPINDFIYSLVIGKVDKQFPLFCMVMAASCRGNAFFSRDLEAGRGYERSAGFSQLHIL